MDDTNNRKVCKAPDSPRLRAWRHGILIFMVPFVAFQYHVNSVIAPATVRITGVMWNLPEQEDEATVAMFVSGQLGLGAGVLELIGLVFALQSLARCLLARSWGGVTESALLVGLCVAGIVLAVNIWGQFID